MTQQYSTGELAKLVNVTIRTVQYYDKRGILSPSQVTEGGRRLYTTSDLDKLRIICFLRELDFSIDEIKRLLAEQDADQLLELLLTEQIEKLRGQLIEKKKQVDTCVNLLKQIKGQSDQALTILPALAVSLKEKASWRDLQRRLWLSIVLSLIPFLMIIFWLQAQGDSDFLSLLGMGLTLLYLGFLLSLSYQFSRQISYICPACYHIFQPNYWEFTRATHTLRTRRLSCPNCQQTTNCLEIAHKNTQTI